MRLDVHLATRGPAELLRALHAQLDALSRIDGDQIAGLPPLLSSGVRYRAEMRGRNGRVLEQWRDARTVYRARVGDCEDLCAWLCAELRAAGQGAIPLPFYATPGLIHCVVWTESGVLDPSRALGMPMLPGSDFSIPISDALRVILE